MERIGVLVVSYGSRAAAMVDAFYRSQEYDAEMYIVDKQRNPFNTKRCHGKKTAEFSLQKKYGKQP